MFAIVNLARVLFRFQEETGIAVYSGRLMADPYGTLWAFPEAQSHHQNWTLQTAYKLNASHLIQSSDTFEDKPVYQYRLVVNALPPGWQTHPVVPESSRDEQNS